MWISLSYGKGQRRDLSSLRKKNAGRIKVTEEFLCRDETKSLRRMAGQSVGLPGGVSVRKSVDRSVGQMVD